MAPRSPRILLIPNNSHWILAQMCAQIQLALQDRFDFFIVPETLFEARPVLWDRILPQIDLVHCMNESSGAILQAHGAPSQPILTWIHHVTHWSPDHEASCQVSNAIIACTDGWKQTIAPYTQKPIHVVRHGVDPVRFTRVPGARKLLGIPQSDFVLGFFGSKGSDSDNNRKGMDTFLEVVQRCGSTIPNLRILLLGPGWEADVARFDAAGIKVTYPGFLAASDLPAAYSAVDVYLMTARVEGGPCTVLESMACGTPVVATRVGLVPDVVVHGENSFSAEVGDVEALSAAVSLIAHDPALHTRMSAAARATAAQLTWPAMLAPLADLYTSLLPEPSSAAQNVSSAQLNKAAVAAEAILGLRYALASEKKMSPNKKWKALKLALQTAGGPVNFLRAFRMASRGEL